MNEYETFNFTLVRCIIGTDTDKPDRLRKARMPIEWPAILIIGIVIIAVVVILFLIRWG